MKRGYPLVLHLPQPVFPIFSMFFRMEQFPFTVNRFGIARQIEGLAAPADKGCPFTPLQGAQAVIYSQNPGILMGYQLDGRLF